eukprot:CAMPEP_0172691140 /NCGR_PEP_ID=MMETSP1074-20121228/24350_1 /TAXON_ID=2916 /ORGANISM="Ceratium fusus, Strain PA161109" /LENGTH=78 /DNA_ID=CAMNT_0013511167 /DNA_START=253 /DNA_END=489 /DNA_ORIENTATION=-
MNEFKAPGMDDCARFGSIATIVVRACMGFATRLTFLNGSTNEVKGCGGLTSGRMTMRGTADIIVFSRGTGLYDHGGSR